MSQGLIDKFDVAFAHFDHPGYVAGRRYPLAYPGTISGGAQAPGANSIKLFPFQVFDTVTIDQIRVRVSAVGAGGNVQAAIYAMDYTKIAPTGNPLLTTGNISTSAQQVVPVAASLQLTPGWYWGATNCDNGSAVFPVMNVGSSFLGYVLGSVVDNDLLTSQTFAGYSLTQTFGSWPNLTGSSPASGSSPLLSEVTSASIPVFSVEIGSVP